jgi:hypothetical protein
MKASQSPTVCTPLSVASEAPHVVFSGQAEDADGKRVSFCHVEATGLSPVAIGVQQSAVLAEAVSDGSKEFCGTETVHVDFELR